MSVNPWRILPRLLDAWVRGVRGFIWSGVVILACVTVAHSAEKRSTTPARSDRGTSWVDLDGDGINDNLPDLNEDGIPDPLGGGGINLNGSEQPWQLLVSPSTLLVVAAELSWLSPADEFAVRRFGARDLATARGAFVTQSDESTGSATEATGAVTCAGGVCVPR